MNPMPFQKGNKYGAKKILRRPLDKKPLCFATWKGQREQIMKIPGWRDNLRAYVDKLIAEYNFDGE